MGVCDCILRIVSSTAYSGARTPMFFPVFLFVSSAPCVRGVRSFVARDVHQRVEGGDDGRARDVVAREHEMAEIETTYQVIKYEVRTRADVGETRWGTMGGWVDECERETMAAWMMTCGWMVKTRGGRTRGWRD